MVFERFSFDFVFHIASLSTGNLHEFFQTELLNYETQDLIVSL